MSSLAAARADGYYYPPDWKPSDGKGGSGKKKRKRPAGDASAAPTIRFEMPFDVTCASCSRTIAKGVRFNAKKRAVGKYLGTTEWAFAMRTACCQNPLEIRTDPKHAEYVVAAGATRRAVAPGAATRRGAHASEQPSPLDLEGTAEVDLQSREAREAMRGDGMAALERAAEMRARGESGLGKAADDDDVPRAMGRETALWRPLSQPSDRETIAGGSGGSKSPPASDARSLAYFREESDARWRDDYDANRILRRAMREDRAEIRSRDAERKALGLPEHVALLPPFPADADAAREAFANAGPSFDRGGSSSDRGGGGGPSDPPSDRFERNRRALREAIRASSIFAGRGGGSDVARGRARSGATAGRRRLEGDASSKVARRARELAARRGASGERTRG